MDQTHYKQMSGRAGRTGFDDFGESIMMTDVPNLTHVKENLIHAKFAENTLESTIDQYTLRRAVLEVIASTSVKSFKEIGTFLSKLLKVELSKTQKCEKCEESYERNKVIYEADDDMAVCMESDIDEILEQYKQNLIETAEGKTENNAQLNQILEEEPESKDDQNEEMDDPNEPNLDCLNCIYNFVFEILVHLKRKKFLAVSEEKKNGTILPTPLGKA